MGFLILVKHSQSRPQPGIPASEWRLSDEGRMRCRALSDGLAPYRPSRLVSSTEPKAIETGRLVSDHLGLRCEPVEGLHEHLRQNVEFLTEERFERMWWLWPTEPSSVYSSRNVPDWIPTSFGGSWNCRLTLFCHSPS